MYVTHSINRMNPTSYPLTHSVCDLSLHALNQRNQSTHTRSLSLFFSLSPLVLVLSSDIYVLLLSLCVITALSSRPGWKYLVDTVV